MPETLIDFRAISLNVIINEAVPIFVQAYAAAPWNEIWSERLAETRLLELAEHPSCLSVGAFAHNVLIGLAVGTPHTGVAGRSLYAAEIVVAPAQQGKRIGSKLLEVLEQQAIVAGYRSIWLVTSQYGSTADFYAKADFSRRNRLSVFAKRLVDPGTYRA